jgi:hypothetical protein
MFNGTDTVWFLFAEHHVAGTFPLASSKQTCCLQVDVDILSSSSDDKNSDLDVLEEQPSKSDSFVTTGKEVPDLSHEVVHDGEKSVDNNMRRSRVTDPAIIEAQKRNREALARLHQAAEVATVSEDDSSELDLPGILIIRTRMMSNEVAPLQSVTTKGLLVYCFAAIAGPII